MAPVCRSRCWGMKWLPGTAVNVAVTQPLACSSTLQCEQDSQPLMQMPGPAWWRLVG